MSQTNREHNPWESGKEHSHRRHDPVTVDGHFEPGLYIHCSKFVDTCKDSEGLIAESLRGPRLPTVVHRMNYWEPECHYKDIVVVPSLSFDAKELAKLDGVAHYEERQLFNLILLQKPDTRIVFVTSAPLDSSIIEYYWKLLPVQIPFCEIRHRLVLLSTYDTSATSLTEKILKRPRLIHRIQKSLRDPEGACLTTFNCTPAESMLAKAIGIPLLSSKNDCTWWGTKAGGREIFVEREVPCAAGVGDCRSSEELVAKIVQLCEDQPNANRMVVKLNEGFSGEGNALLCLSGIKQRREQDRKLSKEWTVADMRAAVAEEMFNMRFQGNGESWPCFREKIPRLGCIVECFVEGATQTPSFQGWIDTNGQVFAISTHEQVMGGPDGQVYKGCMFPAKSCYRKRIHELGMKVGAGLSHRGVKDFFSVDFVAVPKENGEHELFALEINLRKGGTTHPMMTLKLLCEGSYDDSNGLYMSKRFNKPRYYIASDNLCHEKYIGLLPHDIMETFSETKLHYSPETEKGTVFHLLGALSQFGKIGVTCIGESEAEAEQLYKDTVSQLDRMAEETQLLAQAMNQKLSI